MNPSGPGQTKEEFGSRSVMMTGEAQTTALAEHAKALVNARFIMALQRPRSWDDVRVRLLKECERPGFAEVARYNKPIGDGVQGPSIRFAEACVRYAGNIDCPVTTTYEDRFKRVLHVQALDLETNASYSADVTIEKTVERKSRADRVVIAERTNSAGKTVYIVEATEDELLNKTNAFVSKSVRTLSLRLIPGDLVEEGQEACIQTLRNRAAKDPDGERKRLCDAFAKLGIMPSDLLAFIGHPLEQIQPAELTDLRAIFQTIRDGETTWAAVIDARRGPKAESGNGKDAGTTQAQSVAEKVKSRTGVKPAEPPTAQADQPVVTPPPQPQPAPGPIAQAPAASWPACATCGKPITGDDEPVKTSLGEGKGVGWRHGFCPPLGLAVRSDGNEPWGFPERTREREPGEEG